MAHRMLLYDIPDAYRPVRDWLDELSNEDFLAHITMVQKFGPVFSSCELLANDLWALRVPIGYGNVANLVFLSLNTRDFSLSTASYRSGARAARPKCASRTSGDGTWNRNLGYGKNSEIRGI